MRERGVSPIVATVILIAITIAASAPITYYVSTRITAPARPRRTDLEVYAGLVNENVVQLRVKHAGGQTIYDPLREVEGWAGQTELTENKIYCWTFKKQERFRLGDFARCEFQWRGADFRIGGVIRVRIYTSRMMLFNGEVIISDIGGLPG